MYNKLFGKILDSSIWLETNSTRIVWITLLAAMDEDGFCQFASVGNLAQRAVVSREEAEAAAKVLESPDLESSDPENDGRRIERVPGGWYVLNAKKYKALATSEMARAGNRRRVQRFREKGFCNGDVMGCNDSVTLSETETETERTLALSAEDPALKADGVFELPLIGDRKYQVPKKLFDAYILAYPGVSVMAELNKMLSWLLSNPSRRKTVRGMPVFMNRWLEKAQNSVPARTALPPPAPAKKFRDSEDVLRGMGITQ